MFLFDFKMTLSEICWGTLITVLLLLVLYVLFAVLDAENIKYRKFVGGKWSQIRRRTDNQLHWRKFVEGDLTDPYVEKIEEY